MINDDAIEICQKALEANVLVFATPIYYYEMSGQLKTMLDRLNPLYPSDYAFTDVYFLSSAAEDEEEVPERAVNGVEGWVECFERAHLAGSVFMGGVTAAGEKPEHEAINETTIEVTKEILMIRKRFVFNGRVQGVGFRYLTRRAADLIGVTGWVRNERDGSVTLEIQGTEEQVDGVMLIESIDEEEVPLVADETGFKTRF